MKKIKNRLLTALLFALLILPCTLIVTACGVEHKAVTEWSSNDLKHWHTCVVEDCEEKFDEADHTINPKTNICDVCGYEKHEAKTEWAKNDTKHWHNCKIADCEEKYNESDHTINSETNTCDVCGYEKHEVANDTWLSDAEKHWHGCKVAGCNEKYDEVAHSFDAESHICLCGEVESTMTVKVKTGDTFKAYKKIKDAVENAASGSTIYLLKDVTFETSMPSNKYVFIDNKELTIDFGGFTATSPVSGFQVRNGGKLTVLNGKLEAQQNGFWLNNGELTVKNGFEVVGNLGQNNDKSAIVAITDSTLNFAGKATVTKGVSAISGVGNAGQGNVKINILEGAEVIGENVGIYMPNNGELNITGGTITAKTAVYVKSGTTTISGGTLKAIGDKVAYNKNTNGCNATGDALIIDACCKYPGGNPSINITGGKFESANGDAVGYYHLNDTSDYKAEITNTAGVQVTDHNTEATTTE